MSSKSNIAKLERNKLTIGIVRISLYALIVLASFVFHSFLDGIWDRLSLYIAGMFVIFFLSEVMATLSLLVGPPPTKVTKPVQDLPKPAFTPTMDLRDSERNISGCLNRSVEMLTTPTKKSPLSTSMNSSLRHRYSSPHRSISNAAELEEYLDSFTGPDNKSTLIQPNKTAEQNWTSPVRFLDVANKFTFQMSRSPPSHSPADASNDAGSDYRTTNAWIQLGVVSGKLHNWQLNLRKYLWSTVVSPLSKEIRNVNRQLKICLPDVQIGKTSISDLQMVSNPTLSSDIRRLIPYLEVCANHGYLVKRLESLAEGGYLSKYVWDGGEDYNGSKWSNQYPTDTAILMHIFSCWLDSHLPPDPSAGPDARAFSDRYLRKFKLQKTTDQKKTNVKTAHSLPVRVPTAIVEHSVYPPEYFVQHLDREKLKNEKIEYQIREVPAGRQNPLQALLLLFYLLNKYNYGEISGVSLGPAGLNILSVFNEN